MSLDIGAALRTGLDRTLERNGAILFVLFFVLQVVGVIASQSALEPLSQRLIQQLQGEVQEPLPPELVQLPERSPPLATPIPLEGAIALMLATFVLGQTVRVLSDRTFISDETEHLYEPRRQIGFATLSSLVGVIVIFALGFLLTLPLGVFAVINPILSVLWGVIALGIGIVLGVSFYFFRQEIATRDISPINALADSWSLVADDRFAVLGLAVSLLFIDFVVGMLGGSLIGLLGPFPAVIADITIGSALLVFSSAVTAQAYRQLRAEKRGGIPTEQSEGSSTTADDDWEPDDEWNDPPL